MLVLLLTFFLTPLSWAGAVTSAELSSAYEAGGATREISLLAEVAAEAKSGDLVVFDIDNTLIRPIQTIGSDPWFDHMVKKGEAAGFTKEEAIKRAQTEAQPIMAASRVIPVETDTARIIAELQRKNISVIALTYRHGELAATTKKDLTSVGIKLQAAPGIEARDGVLFAAGDTKGAVLSRYLEKARVGPKRILFIDDKSANVEALEKHFAEGAGPEVVAFRYGAADPVVKSFDGALADAQLEHYHRTGALETDAGTRSRVSTIQNGEAVSMLGRDSFGCSAEFAVLVN